MYLVKVGEIFLKGKNRGDFFSLLCDNIASTLGCQRKNVWFAHNMIFVAVEDGSKLACVFGIHSYLKVTVCDFASLGAVAASFVGSQKTFAVRCSRSTKEYKKSQEIAREVGAAVWEQHKYLKVDLSHPELTISITICAGKAYVGADLVYGLGGLPVGCSGTVFLDASACDSAGVAAGFLLMKRGCRLVLSEDIPALHVFDAGLSVGEQNDLDLAVSTVDPVAGFVLQPLVGYSADELKAISRTVLRCSQL